MAEVPFMALCAAVLLALCTADSSMRAFGAGLLAAAAFMVRGYGVAFLPAALIWFATRTGVSPKARAFYWLAHSSRR